MIRLTVICVALLLLIPVSVSAKAKKKKIKELTVPQISRYMAMGTVEEILNGTVSYITPDTWNDIVDNGYKPALVLVYSNTHFKNANKRSAIIFSKLAEKYGDLIDFYACEDENSLLRTHKIYGPPSISMHARYDVAEGETPNDPGDHMKQIDVLRGGPGKDKSICSWLGFISDKWIPTNFTEMNDQFAWRFDNSGNERKIPYK